MMAYNYVLAFCARVTAAEGLHLCMVRCAKRFYPYVNVILRVTTRRTSVKCRKYTSLVDIPFFMNIEAYGWECPGRAYSQELGTIWVRLLSTSTVTVLTKKKWAGKWSSLEPTHSQLWSPWCSWQDRRHPCAMY